MDNIEELAQILHGRCHTMQVGRIKHFILALPLDTADHANLQVKLAELDNKPTKPLRVIICETAVSIYRDRRDRVKSPV